LPRAKKKEFFPPRPPPKKKSPCFLPRGTYPPLGPSFAVPPWRNEKKVKKTKIVCGFFGGVNDIQHAHANPKSERFGLE
jgi:hypothetical protein